MDLVTTGAALAVGKKLLGKTFDVISSDLANLYVIGRDKIIDRTNKKITNIDDGKSANLRVTRDVFWNGSFSDEAICAEYFGGILASSRSDDGKDDTGVFYVDLIKSLSSKQILTHYLLYRTLNKILAANKEKANLNPGLDSDLSPIQIYFSLNELRQLTNDQDIGRDLHILHSRGLIEAFQADTHKLKNGKDEVPFVWFRPTSLGIQLYSVAHNLLNTWRDFAKKDFGDFESIVPPKYSGENIEELLTSAGLKDKEPAEKKIEN